LLRDESETAVSSETTVSASTLNLILDTAPAPPEPRKLPRGIAEPEPRSLDPRFWALIAARTVLREFRLGRVSDMDAPSTRQVRTSS
jgi:hypothetical protein